MTAAAMTAATQALTVTTVATTVSGGLATSSQNIFQAQNGWNMVRVKEAEWSSQIPGQVKIPPIGAAN